MSTEREWEELNIDETIYPTRLTEKYRRRKTGGLEDSRIIRAAVPGKILEINVEPGEPVRRGRGLLVLEAMKMENTIRAVVDGAIGELHVAPGTLVAKGDLLVTIERE